MKKSFILITLIAVLTASVALACAADNPECTYPGPTEWAVVEGYTVHYECTIHVDCSVTERWGYFGWRCPPVNTVNQKEIPQCWSAFLMKPE